MYNTIIRNLFRSESIRPFLKIRNVSSAMHCVSEYSDNAANKRMKKTDDDDDDDEDLNKPYKYSTSKAAQWSPGHGKITDEKPQCQPIVISLSLAIFYTYFSFIREENDIDEKMVANIPIEVQEQIYGKR